MFIFTGGCFLFGYAIPLYCSKFILHNINIDISDITLLCDIIIEKKYIYDFIKKKRNDNTVAYFRT